MNKKPKLLSKRILAQSSLFTIESLDLRFANGRESCYERIHGNNTGAVMIVPLIDDKTVLLIREYAAGVDDYVLGFPKGAIADGEECFATANRELMEEVGYGARRLSTLATVSASPGYMSSMMTIVLAEELYPQRLIGDEPEPIEVVAWHIDKFDELLAHPQFHEARSQAALLFLERHLRNA